MKRTRNRSCPGLGGAARWILAAVLAAKGLVLNAAPADTMAVREEAATGRWWILDAGKPVLAYQYGTCEPGALLGQVSEDNRKYARARSNYIHPLYGLEGEELTRDWPVDHPHHRGIYWAWPEVEFIGERGDLHALQRVFARPTGVCAGSQGAAFAQITAENVWKWEDAQPIVREVAKIRASRVDAAGRWIDLEIRIEAMTNGVTLARRETRLYGGLNQRLAPVSGQEIEFHTGAPGSMPVRAWADLSGVFAGGKNVQGLGVLQHPGNPHFPGDWVKYPELNWFQPTFPAAGTRHVLKPGEPLLLRYRLLVHAGRPAASVFNRAWDDFAAGR